MTEGLFAVVGALVGAGGAWVAALIAGKAARYQADKQAAAAHDQWLRQVRRDVYSAFLAEARSAVRTTFFVASMSYSMPHQSLTAEQEAALEVEIRDLLSTFNRRLVTLYDKAEAMKLEATTDLTAKVDLFLKEAQELHWLVDQLQAGARARDKWDELEQLLNEVTEMCRVAIQRS
ncbi:hypothetical protein [Streptomyces sp. NPDC058066]|uniref:hypothetical protein n=1 Tax=Streptomyces sp. NPDC058066 TaxID=3346323 RepID=UPI0036EAAF96